jgi:Fibronectin type III domain
MMRLQKGGNFMRSQPEVPAAGALPVVVAVMVALVSAATASELGAQAPGSFAEAEIRIEVNSTDGDAGLQVDLDGEAWNEVTIVGPDGRILNVTAKGNLQTLGLTELFFESQEPSFDELPLEEFLELFPEGEYRFLGKTVEGTNLVSSATLTHDIPAGPIITAPRDGAVVNRKKTVIAWMPVTRPRGIEIVGYQVIVERPEPTLLVFSVDLPATATSVTVPREFLEPGTEYVFEVLAIEAGGNQTISEGFFQTRHRGRNDDKSDD